MYVTHPNITWHKLHVTNLHLAWSGLTSPICRASRHLLTFSRNLAVAASSSALSSAAPDLVGVTEWPMGVSSPASVMVITGHEVTIASHPLTPCSSQNKDSIREEKIVQMMMITFPSLLKLLFPLCFYHLRHTITLIHFHFIFLWLVFLSPLHFSGLCLQTSIPG